MKNNEQSPWEKLPACLQSVWFFGVGSEIRRSQLEAWGWLFTEALRNTGMVHDVWTKYTETQLFGKHQHSSGSKMELWAYQPGTCETFQYWWSSSNWLRGTCTGASLPSKPSAAPFMVKLGKTLLPGSLSGLCCLMTTSPLPPLLSNPERDAWSNKQFFFSRSLRKNSRTHTTRKEALEVWWPRKKKSWSWPEEGVPRIIRHIHVLNGELQCAIWVESSLWRQGAQMAAASNQRNFSCAAWRNSISIS